MATTSTTPLAAVTDTIVDGLKGVDPEATPVVWNQLCGYSTVVNGASVVTISWSPGRAAVAVCVNGTPYEVDLSADPEEDAAVVAAIGALLEGEL